MVSSFVFVVLLVTVVVGFGRVVQAKPGDCCGRNYGGSCDLQYPYQQCSGGSDCTNSDFKDCCPAGGFCAS